MADFLNNKYSYWYNNIISTAKARTLPAEIYTENHHILPKSLGGDNSRPNLVKLTAREHFVCHWLLTKMIAGQQKYKMLEAFSIFSHNKNRQHKFNSHQISAIRQSNAIAASNRNKGNQNYLQRKPISAELKILRSKNAKGSRWVNNGSEEKFTKDHVQLFNSGFVYGRLPMSDLVKNKIKTTYQNKEKVKRVVSKNTRQRMSEAATKRIALLRASGNKIGVQKGSIPWNKNKKRTDLISCVFCKKTVIKSNFTRWHKNCC